MSGRSQCPKLNERTNPLGKLDSHRDNIYDVSVIPEWNVVNGNLPEGEHTGTWDEVQRQFGFTARPRLLLQGLQEGLDILSRCGCSTAWLDGSFVADKPDPGDFDCCWDYSGVDIAALKQDHPEFFDFRHLRRAQKERFGGEFFLAHIPADLSGTAFLDFFQIDKYTGERKGIVRLDLLQFHRTGIQRETIRTS